MYDIFIVDQLSASVPLLRWLTDTRVVFYCHFPDLLLSPDRDARGPTGLVRTLYRAPLDFLEERTTASADTILVNSQFTADVFGKTFPNIRENPAVVHPGIDAQAFGKASLEFDAELQEALG